MFNTVTPVGVFHFPHFGHGQQTAMLTNRGMKTIEPDIRDYIASTEKHSQAQQVNRWIPALSKRQSISDKPIRG
jgi:hypothetical protein